MSIVDGRYEGDSKEEILDAMMADAKEYFGSDLNDNEYAVIRMFYEPIAERLAIAQESIGLILDSAQLEHATGRALDLLCALIGIQRKQATHAEVDVTFSRESAAGQDYIIPSGTIVQTDALEPLRFETVESTTLAEGDTTATVGVRALDTGPESNVGTNAISIMPDRPAGVDSVTNPTQATGGSEREGDDSLRARAKKELAEGSRASAPALINNVRSVQGVTAVAIEINDTSDDNTGSGGLPDHSFELIVSGGDTQEIAQAILDTKAAGDTSYGGANGVEATAEAELPNGQTHEISFSRPNDVQIHVSAEVEVTEDFSGTEPVKENIVSYIGGILPSGNGATGLGAGDDVIYGEVQYAIRDVPGVHDITDLQVGTSDPPSGTSNVSITNAENPTADGTDDSLTINTTVVDQ